MSHTTAQQLWTPVLMLWLVGMTLWEAGAATKKRPHPYSGPTASEQQSPGDMPQPQSTMADTSLSLLYSMAKMDVGMCQYIGEWAAIVATTIQTGTSSLPQMPVYLQEILSISPEWAPWFEDVLARLQGGPMREASHAKAVAENDCLMALTERMHRPPLPFSARYTSPQAPAHSPSSLPASQPRTQQTWVLWRQGVSASTAVSAWPTKQECEAWRDKALQQGVKTLLTCLPDTVQPRMQR